MTKIEFLKSRGYNYSNSLEKSNVKLYVIDLIFCSLMILLRKTGSNFYLKIEEDMTNEQEYINNLQTAFNIVKRDFEEVMKLED